MKKAAIITALLASHAFVGYVFYWTGVEDAVESAGLPDDEPIKPEAIVEN